ncbi:MAG: hypothetical protein C5B51_00320 [Terriglobia bacterium]|nr:MAG: hypothetical protein C5B51_00320 [Terriglobia bacterium]
MVARNFLVAILAVIPAAFAQSITGLWDASMQINGLTIPFRMEFTAEGSNVTGAFFNGDERFTSTGGRLEDGALRVEWEHYDSRLEAQWKGDTLTGSYTHGGRRGGSWPFTATRHTASPAADANAPSIAGLWELQQVRSGKRESTWRFIVQQSGGEVSATTLRVDGDTGGLTGVYHDGKFVLSHFDGSRWALMEVKLTNDGELEILSDGKTRMTAVRPAEARSRNLPPPADFNTHTSVKDPNEPFRFRFPDLNGRMVSNTDPRFRGKVVLVEITGSWCPNCHDEAPFLVDLYKKYKEQGLEIVSLSFEEGDQLKNPKRLRAFIRKYGIEFPVLLCGEPEDAKEKLTQAVDWDAWPTTFFLDRRGLVRRVHAGFPSSPSAELYREAIADFQSEVVTLLGEPRP